MGWFDEEDDDDEEGEHNKKESSSRPSLLWNPNDNNDNNNDGGTNKAGDENEEEVVAVDPLDAFMKDLASQSTNATTTTTTTTTKSATRLDMENEDEATSHWETKKSSNSKSSNSTTTIKRCDDNDDDGDDEQDDSLSFSQSRAEAKSALHQTFHKASTAGAGGDGNNNNNNDSRQVDIQLETLQHASNQYPPIVKKLWTTTNTTSTMNTSEGHAWRKEHLISCHPPIDPIYHFAELREVLPSFVMDWIASQPGMLTPTLVQSQTFSVALCGLDAIVTASTGSGKTLAYLLPIVAHLDQNNNTKAPLDDKDKDSKEAPALSTKKNKNRSRALILVPTRELALQVEKVAKALLAQCPWRALAITGGTMGRYQLSQTLQNSKPQIVIATPGRLLDVLKSQQKSKHQWLLEEITFVVLDEADKMLQLGFANQVHQILENLRPDRQSILTSATLHGKLERHCQKWLSPPTTRIQVGTTGRSSDHVQQHLVCLPDSKAKEAFLVESIPTFCEVGRTLVFCATREGCEVLAKLLVERLESRNQVPPALQTLHGDKHPADRKAALRAFTKGQVSLLIATDVAGRGLDVPQVATVINYDPAKNWDTHVHRIGRAGRLSATTDQRQEGSAYTLLTPRNRDFCRTLVQAYEREGRALDDQVRQWAKTFSHSQHSQHSQGGSRASTGSQGYYGPSGAGGSSTRQAGLGFQEDGTSYEPSRPPPRKKSRWG